MIHIFKKSLFLILCSCPLLLSAQLNKDNSGGVLLINFEYGAYVPGGDLNERFGFNSGAGGGFEFITNKNLSFQLDASFYFGRKVKEDVLANLRNEDGWLIGNNRTLAINPLRSRALYIGTGIGKLFPINKKNFRSGIKTSLGIGIFQHKIRVQEDPDAFVPAISGDYLKGYDRLSNGLALREFIGYQHLDKNRLINFYVGFELTQAFTKNRRDYDFLTMSKLDESRLDLLFGIKAGWTLPFYIQENAAEIYY